MSKIHIQRTALVEDLIPYANNSRTHSEKQVMQITASIREFGITSPVLVDGDGGIIAGHCRVMAMKILGIKETPVVELVGLTEAQKKAYVIADNQLALNADWNIDLLKLEVDSLVELDFDIDLLGFDDGFIDGLLDDDPVDGLTDEDDCPDPPKDPISKLGDIWSLGEHRLMCGDSTSVDDVESLMCGLKSDLIFTDPPYGMSYGGGRGKTGTTDGTVKSFGMIKGDDKTGVDLISLIRDSLLSAKIYKKDGAAVYVCFPWRTYSEFEQAMLECELNASACIVWDKKSIGLGNANYRPQHEFIFYCKGDSWHGDKSQSDVWYMSRGATGKYVHPTQKPVELIEKAILNSSKKGDVVHDCFGGSGSTLIACEKTKRSARIMELDEKYVDVIVRRWQEFTGKDAVHVESGKLFNEMEGSLKDG